MFNAARGRRASLFGLAVLVMFLILVVGPWALTKWAESRFTQSLGERVQIERVSFNPFTATAAFSALRIGKNDTPMISIESGKVVFSWSTLWQPGIHISEVQLHSPRLHLVSPSSGPLNLTTLGEDSSSGNVAPLGIDRIEADDGRIDWQDRRISGKPSLGATDVSVTLHDYQRSSDSPMQGQASGTVGGGRVDLDGRFGVMPLIGDLSVNARNVAVKAFEPWISAASAVRLERGRVDLDGQVRFGAAVDALIAYQGQLGLDDLATTDKQGQSLLSLEHGVFEGLDFTAGDHLVIDSSRLAAPTLTALIDDDGRLNLTAPFSDGQGGQATNDRQGGDQAAGRGEASPNQGQEQNRNLPQDQARNAGRSQGLAVALNRLEIERGRFDFEDRRMSPTVSLAVSQLSGQFTRFDTRSAKPASYRFEGMESDGTPVRIEGNVSLGNPPGGRMRLTTQHLALSQFAPYIQRFAGYRIEHGIADLELDYLLQGDTLTARNHIILKRLDLGNEIDPNETSLPLKRLIGLLQAETGVINLDIPIETTVDGNTQVDMSVVVWQALTESLNNIVTSPVDSLQALIGGDG